MWEANTFTFNNKSVFVHLIRTIGQSAWRFTMYAFRGFLFVIGLAILGVNSQYLGVIFFWYIVWPGLFQAAQWIIRFKFWKRPRHGVLH